VAKEGYEAGARIRSALESLADRIAPVCEGLDAAEIHALLTREHRQALENLSGSKPDALEQGGH
jgi:hypothetical protein